MAIGSGLGASFGIAAESTYGTGVPVTRWFPGDSFSIEKQQDFQPVSGVAAGRMAPPDDVATREWATGKWNGQVTRTKFGLLLAQLTGSSTTPVQQGATAAYLQTHVWGDDFGKSLTAQIGMPNTAGTVNARAGFGGKINSAEFSCELGGNLMLGAEFDFRKYDEAQAFAAPSYPAGELPFTFAQSALKLGTFGSEAVVQGVRKVGITFARGRDTERFYAGNAGLKSEPIYNAMSGITGSLDVDLVTKADFHDRWVGNTATSLVWEFVGPIIASTFAYTFRITLPRVKFKAGIDEVSGPDVNKGSIPIEVFQDPTNGFAKFELITTDVTI